MSTVHTMVDYWYFKEIKCLVKKVVKSKHGGFTSCEVVKAHSEFFAEYVTIDMKYLIDRGIMSVSLIKVDKHPEQTERELFVEVLMRYEGHL